MRSDPEDLHLPPQKNCTAEYARLAKDVEKLKEQQLEEWYEQNQYGCRDNDEIYNLVQKEHAYTWHIEECIETLHNWIDLDETELAFKFITHADEYKMLNDSFANILDYLDNTKDLTSKQQQVKDYLRRP